MAAASSAVDPAGATTPAPSTPKPKVRARMCSAAHEQAMKTMKDAKDAAADSLKKVRQQLKQDAYALP